VGVSSDEIAAHGDEDHCMGYVDALLVVTHEATPFRHPCKGSLDHPMSGQDLEAFWPSARRMMSMTKSLRA